MSKTTWVVSARVPAPVPQRAADGTPARADVDARVADIHVVIVSFWCRDLILRTLGSVLDDSSGLHISVTVVDNGSRDGTLAAVRATYPQVRTIQLDTNTGFAHASNIGMRAESARYQFVLNPDTVVTAGALAGLVEFADAHPEAGVVAPALRNADGTDQLTARAFPTPAAAVFGRRSPLTRLAPDNRWSTRFLAGRGHTGDAPFAVDWVSGAAMLVPRAVIEDVGVFDEGYFLFWEDADWCRRIVDTGRQVWCVPTAVVVHDEGGSRDHGWSAATIRWFHQGSYRYWRTHHAPSPLNPARWFAAAALTARAAVLTARYARPAGPIRARAVRSPTRKESVTS